ncbi:MAG TPA: ABC transporter ATP-binding protein [Fimbriimonadaceae bacterium]|nr:ABC transporter ATP-binding protein [Fimbriimonadaceae bacterium]
MSEPVVFAENLMKTYYGKVDTPVLKGVDLAVFPGQFIAVMGQSGSGKSTLLNLLGCLDRPTGGTLKIAGGAPADMDDDELARLRSEVLGFVFQNHNLLDEFSCEDNALLPILIRKGRVPVADRERVRKLLVRVGLHGELHKHPDEMSGGQNQRTSIVRALANEPQVILADEPTGNLDSTNGAEVFKLFRELGKETGTAVIMVTHDDRLANQADSILEIHDGKLLPSA